jgi:hypothetical protein
MLRAPIQSSAANDEIIAWDNFTNAAYTGALTGEVGPLGGTWSGAGDTDDFTQDTTNLWTQRTANSDADVVTGRYARLGTGVASDVQVQADVKATLNLAASTENRLGIFARYVDTSNWLMAVMRTVGAGATRHRDLALYKRVSGTTTLLSTVELASGAGSEDYDWRTIKLTADAAGNVSVWEGAQGADLGSPKLTVETDVNLATGGALDDGGYGIYDACTSTTGTNTRRLDNLSVTEPVGGGVISDAVLYADQTAELGTAGMFRMDSTGTAPGPVSLPSGDLPRVPVSGLEGRPVELFILTTRGDLVALPDTGADDPSAVVHASPSHLFVPDN